MIDCGNLRHCILEVLLQETDVKLFCICPGTHVLCVVGALKDYCVDVASHV